MSVIREKYRTLASHGCTLYFVVASLSEIDFMYQFSLKYFKSLFTQAFQNSEKYENVSARLDTLVTQSTMNIYSNISR